MYTTKKARRIGREWRDQWDNRETILARIAQEGAWENESAKDAQWMKYQENTSETWKMVNETRDYLKYVYTTTLGFPQAEEKSSEKLLEEMGFILTGLTGSLGSSCWEIWRHRTLPFLAEVGGESHYEQKKNWATHEFDGGSSW